MTMIWVYLFILLCLFNLFLPFILLLLSFEDGSSYLELLRLLTHVFGLLILAILQFILTLSASRRSLLCFCSRFFYSNVRFLFNLQLSFSFLLSDSSVLFLFWFYFIYVTHGHNGCCAHFYLIMVVFEVVYQISETARFDASHSRIQCLTFLIWTKFCFILRKWFFILIVCLCLCATNCIYLVILKVTFLSLALSLLFLPIFFLGISQRREVHAHTIAPHFRVSYINFIMKDKWIFFILIEFSLILFFKVTIFTIINFKLKHQQSFMTFLFMEEEVKLSILWEINQF